MRTRTNWLLIWLLWLAGLGAAGQYGKISVIFDRLPAIYPDAGQALGFIVSLVGFVGIVFGVVAGLLVARLGYRRALIWALWGGATLSTLQALLPPLPIMLGLRALEGASHLAIVVTAPTLIAQLSATRHSGLSLTLWSTFFGVSYTALVWAGLPLVEAYGVPALFLAHAAWMAALAMLLGRNLRTLSVERPTGAMTLASVLRNHLTIYRSPYISAPAIGWLFYTFCFLALLTLIPPYLPDDLRAPALGAMPLVLIAVSMTLGVALLRYVSGMVVILTGFGFTVLSLLWLLAAPGLPLACLVLAGALGLVQGASFAVVPQLNTTAATQAQANGAMAQMGNVGNTLGTPALAGVLSVAGYHGMIALAALVFATGAAMHIWLAFRRRS